MSFWTLLVGVLGAAAFVGLLLAPARRQLAQRDELIRRLPPQERLFHPLPAPFAWSSLVFGGILLVAAWAVYGRPGWTAFRGGLAALLLVIAVFTILLDLDRLRGRHGLKDFALLLLLLGAGGWLFHVVQADRRAQQEAERLAAAESAAAGAIREARQEWSPGPGVTEVCAGAVRGWLAVQPEITLDWEYEQSREAGGRAERQIPLGVVLLNDSFADAALLAAAPEAELAGEAEPELWRVWIARANSDEVLREWRQPAPAARVTLFPVERADFWIDWDGRDAAGALLPPGEYTAYLVTAPVEPAEESEAPVARSPAPLMAAVAFSLVDRGPETIVEPDPLIEGLRQQEQWNQLLQQMQENLRMQQQMQFDQMHWR